MKNLTIKGYGELPLNVFLYDKVKKPKASILIFHGMQEHGARYDEFAKFLESNNFVVLVSDLRGHGKTATSPENYGKGVGDDIFAEIIEDQKILAEYLTKNYNCPLYVFGHSYGSFVCQKMIQVCSQIEKAVICGTTNGDALIIDLGQAKGDNWWCVVYPPLCFVGDSNANVIYKSKIKEIINRFYR